jgi:uncharacterized membrane protein required for colicin V production
MSSQITPILLSLIVLAALLIPAIRGAIAGFVKTALNLLRFILSAVIAFSFAKPLGVFLKEKWLGEKFYDMIWKTLSETFDFSSSASSLADSLPAGLRAILEAFGVDVGAMATNAAQEGELMLKSFAQTAADKVATIVGVVISFVVLFFLSILLLWLVSLLLTKLIEKIPFVSGLNRILGFLLGLLIGVVTAWSVAQILAVILTAFTDIDYTQIAVLRFFHDISPIRLILQFITERITSVAA